jgi:hypothetical protein
VWKPKEQAKAACFDGLVWSILGLQDSSTPANPSKRVFSFLAVRCTLVVACQGLNIKKPAVVNL